MIRDICLRETSNRAATLRQNLKAKTIEGTKNLFTNFDFSKSLIPPSQRRHCAARRDVLNDSSSGLFWVERTLKVSKDGK